MFLCDLTQMCGGSKVLLAQYAGLSGRQTTSRCRQVPLRPVVAMLANAPFESDHGRYYHLRALSTRPPDEQESI